MDRVTLTTRPRKRKKTTAGTSTRELLVNTGRSVALLKDAVTVIHPVMGSINVQK